jgi:hypothetical protein
MPSGVARAIMTHIAARKTRAPPPKAISNRVAVAVASDRRK